jgi:hypothetical protein
MLKVGCMVIADKLPDTCDHVICTGVWPKLPLKMGPNLGGAHPAVQLAGAAAVAAKEMLELVASRLPTHASWSRVPP